MFRSNAGRAVAVAAAWVLVSGMAGCPIRPDPPSHQTTNQQPQVSESVIQVPFQTADLQAIAGMVNDPNVVPKGKDGEGAWGDVGHDGLWDKVSWNRDDFSVTASGNAIELVTTVHYAVRLAHSLGGTHVQFVQCGHGEPEATFTVGVRATITPNTDWSLTVDPTLIGPTPGTPCNLGGIGPATYNASGKIADLVRNLLNDKLGDIKGRINSELQFKDKAAEAWQQLQAAVGLGSDTYFVATLSGVNLAPLSAANNKVTLVGGISGTARVVIGGPVASAPPSPLPPLQIADKPPGFHIELPVSISYDQLSTDLNQRLSGRRYPFADNTVTINGVSVYGTSDQLVLQLDLTLSGVGSATVYITGTPEYDALRRVVSASHLQYTKNTSDALITVADWFLHSEFLSIMEAEAHYDIGNQVDAMRAKATAAINRSLGPHANLAGSVSNLSLLGFGLSANEITVYVVADGNATVTVH